MSAHQNAGPNMAISKSTRSKNVKNEPLTSGILSRAIAAVAMYRGRVPALHGYSPRYDLEGLESRIMLSVQPLFERGIYSTASHSATSTSSHTLAVSAKKQPAISLMGATRSEQSYNGKPSGSQIRVELSSPVSKLKNWQQGIRALDAAEKPHFPTSAKLLPGGRTIVLNFKPLPLSKLSLRLASSSLNSATSGKVLAIQVNLPVAPLAESPATQAPAITSANTAPFAAGTHSSFTVTTTGSPVAALSSIGALPSGLTFTDNGNGTATLSGTPAAGTEGAYNVTLTANNGIAPIASQAFTLQVTGPAVVGLPGFFINNLGASDDGSTSAIPLGFAAPINFFGHTYSSIFINNNGNVTFDAPLSTFTPFPLTGTATKIIAPYFADVDTRGSTSGTVHYGTGIVNGRAAFGIEWPDVGYYFQKVNRLNDFELIIIDRSDTGPGNFDFEFNYNQVQWQAGDDSGGSSGLGGTPARAGYSASATGPSTELAGSGVNGAFLDTNTTSGLIYKDLNSTVPGRYVFNVRNGAVVFPDLTVTGLAISPPAPQSGQQVTVNWNDANIGNGPTLNSFDDHVTVVNTTTGQTLVSQDVLYDASSLGNIAASGGSAARSLSFGLPPGNAGVGNLSVMVTTDSQNNVAESNSGGTGETNNTSSIVAAATLAPYPDLQVGSLTTTPSSGLQSGQSLLLQWNDLNTGTAPTTGAFDDHVNVVNQTTGQTLLSADLAGANSPIAAGSFVARSDSLRLPDGTSGVGQLQITVTEDSLSNVSEFNAAGTGESNNTASTSAMSVLAPYPDLKVQNLSFVPANGLKSGQTLTINWIDTNSGNGAAAGPWSDKIQVVNASTGQTLLNTAQAFTNSINAGASAARSVQYPLPDGATAVGNLLVTVTADSNNNLFEFNAAGTAETNNSANANIVSTIAPYPDLQIQNLTALPVSGLQSGGLLTINWSDVNSGNAAVTASFSDLLQVMNVTTGQTLLTTAVTYNEAASGPVAAGAGAGQTYQFQLPDGIAGAGQLRITVTTNINNSIFEYNSAGTAQSNNIASILTSSTIAPYPDLQVQNLAVSPASLQSGGLIKITWADANTGAAAIGNSFSDLIQVLNTTTGFVLQQTTVTYNESVSGPIMAGSAFDQSYQFKLPDGMSGAGQLQVTVTSNINHSVFEYNLAGTAQSNNTSTINVTSVLAPYPDLAVNNVTGPTAANPTQLVTVTWSVMNNGAAVATGPWTEQIFLATSANNNNPTLLAAQTFAGTIAPGQSVPRSSQVQIPNLAAGNYWFVVSENPFGDVFETNTVNNTVVATAPLAVAGALTLSLANHTVSNAAGANATIATISRNTDPTNPLIVTIANSNPGEVSVPSTITIPAGQTSITVPIATLDGNIVVGTETANLTASATGEQPGSDVLTITDSNVPTLTLHLSTQTLSESDSNPAATGTVTTNYPANTPLVVSLFSNASNKLTVPATVTIPAGQTSATFPITVIDDHQIDGDASATITASASGFVSAASTATVTDINVPVLGLTLAQTSVSEAGGVDATNGMITLTAPLDAPVTVSLLSSDATAVTVPVQVILQAGQTSATFPVTAIDDGLETGNRTATITAEVNTSGGHLLTSGAASVTITLIEHDGPALTISLPIAAVAQGGIAQATVTRNTDTTNPLLVMLASSDTTHATLPNSVTIPAGQSSATFLVTGVNDGLPDGEQYSQITASAAGLASAVVTIGVTSVNLPDLTITSVAAPVSGYAGTSIQLSWTVLNNGLFQADGSWTDQVYLDPLNGAQGGGLVDTVTFTGGSLSPGQIYTQTDSITLPSAIGQYNVRIVADADEDLEELSFNNNSATSAQPVNDQAPYSATVSTSISAPVSNGTAIPLSGRVISTVTGLPLPNVPVAVDVLVSGTARVLNAVADSAGNYSLTFQPLTYEAGNYSVAAGYPGASIGPAQATFTIVGMTASPSVGGTIQVAPGMPLTGQFTLTNLSSTPLTGLKAVAEGGPAGLTIQLTPPTTLTALGQGTLSYSITVNNNIAETGTVDIHVTSAEGAVFDFLINGNVVPQTPILSSNPGFLNAGMLVGTQSTVSFQVTNNGGASSGDLQVLLPGTPYLSLASPAAIPGLMPGQSTTVTLLLNPAAGLPLDEYTGTVVISGSRTALSIPFTFRAITSAVGDVQIVVDDIYTYNEAGAPRVANATVALLDPYDNSNVIVSGTTDGTGVATLPRVPAGQYLLQITATGHAAYNATYSVQPGITNTGEVFLANQLITYAWQVTPTDVNDQYTINLQTTFQTDVPAPVVTITAPASLPNLAVGQSAQIDFVLTNHGLIQADNVSIVMPTDPEYVLTALTTEVGTLPAGSSVIVPVTVQRIAATSNNSQISLVQTAAVVSDAASSGASPPCHLYPAVLYYVYCGVERQLTSAVDIYIPGRICDLLVAEKEFLNSIGGGGGGFGGGGVGGGGSSSENSGSYLPPPPQSVSHPPAPVPGTETQQPPVVQSGSNCNPCLAGLLGQFLADSELISKVNNALEGAQTAGQLARYLIETPISNYNPLEFFEICIGGGSPSADDILSNSQPNQFLPDLSYSAKRQLVKVRKVVQGLSDLKNAEDAINKALAYYNACVSAVHGSAASNSEIAAFVLANSAPGSVTDATIAAVEADAARLQVYIDAYVAFFGSSDWLATSQTTILAEWLSAFYSATANTFDGSIDAADQATLLATTRPDTVTLADANEFIARWNRTIAYWDQGINSVAQVPAGQSTDFIDESVMSSDFNEATQAVLASQANGYADPGAQTFADINQMIGAINDNSVCATVQLQINQTVALTREAFSGTFMMSDQMSDDSLQDIALALNVTDASGNPVNGVLFISSPTLGGALTAVDGTGVLPPGSTGSVSYTFIPTNTAAANGPTVYFIGGTLTYVDPDMGGEVVTPIYPAAITVDPQPNLQINYFLQRDVIGEDPSNPQENIQSEPAVLGMLVTNSGKGVANNLSITTSQPQIVQNEKGLLDNFQIIGTQVGNQQVSPSLTADLGNIASGQTADADFLLLSSLQGVFTNFTASFSHSDALGGTDTSLISSVVTHDLVHAGDFNFADSTGAMDYLVDDTPNPDNLPDTIYFSDGSTAAVNIATQVSSTPASGATTYTVMAHVTSGWDYIQLPDPGAGFRLYKVVRSDGVMIPVSDQAWTTDRTFTPNGKATVDNELHILDDNSTGSYTVYYRPTSTVNPAVASLQQVTNPQSGPISSVNITFNEPINVSTFSIANISITLNGGPNLITSAVTISQTSQTLFTIGNLASLTGASGNYVLTVSAAGIQDPYGDVGSGSLSETWAQGAGAPVVVSVGAGDPVIRNTAVSIVDIVLSEPVQPSTFDYRALSLTLNGGTNLITSAITVTEISPTTYQIGGLLNLTQSQGTYTLTVSADGLFDTSNRAGVGAASETWVMDTTAPTIVSLGPTPQTPRNIVVPVVDITFSEAIDPATLTYQDITFTKDGGANLIIPGISITQLTPTEFEVGNFENLVAPIDGDYVFTVNAATISDLAGNAGIGSASETWTLDTAALAAPTNLTITPLVGTNSNGDVTNAASITLTGSLSKPNLTVEVYSGQVLIGSATVTGETFSETLVLAPGSNELSVFAVDDASNVSPTTTLNVFADVTSLTAAFAPVVLTSPQQAVPAVQVTFAKPVDAATFDYRSLTLSLNGGPNLITSGVTIRNVSGNTFEIDGLDTLDAQPGQYELSLTMSQIKDLSGNSGIETPSVSWQVLPQISPASFEDLTASSIASYGTSNVVFSGRVSAGSLVPGANEFVAITLNGVTVDAPINAFGEFAASLDTANLPASTTPYHVMYSYAGDASLSTATDNFTTLLTVNKATPTLSLPASNGQIVYDGTAGVISSVVPTFSGIFGADSPVGSPTILFYIGTSATGLPLSAAPVNAGTYTALASYAGDINYTSVTSNAVTFTIGRAPVIVTLPSPPPTIIYDGTTDVTNWVKAIVAVPAGAPPASGSVTYAYYAGSTVSGMPLTSSPINAGTYTVVAVYGGNSNYMAGQSVPVTFTITQPVAPLSVFFKVDDGTAQRSMVRSLTVTFSSAVTLQAGAITLTDSNGNTISFTLNTSDNITFSLTFISGQFIGGSLANGRYVLTVHSSKVNADGGAQLAADRSLSFWRLFGDYYGTATVNNADKTLFAQEYKTNAAAYLGYFDYDGNGILDTSDLNAFNQDFGKSV
jgi:hypothetical protein